MTSADKLGMVVAVAVVIIFVGLGVGMSNVSEDNARPDIDQQRAVIITEEFMKPKMEPGTGPGSTGGWDGGTGGTGGGTGGTGGGTGGTGGGTGGDIEVGFCSDGSLLPPPEPGVDWSECNISGEDYTGENLSGANMRDIIAVEAILNEADLTRVDARGGDFYDAEIQSATIVGGQFQRANLDSTDFRYSDLRNAIFDNAEMRNAILSETDLSNARFDGITFTETMYSDAMRTDDYTAPSDFTVSNTGLKLLARNSILQDTIFENVVLESFWTHFSSIDNLDLAGVIVNTGYTVDFEPFNEEGWYYNYETSLDCINHVVCDEPGPGLFRNIHQVTPLPEHIEEVRIGNYPYPGHYEDICYRTVNCYVPQVATVLKGGTVTWFNDSIRASDGSEVPYKLVSGTPEDGPDGIFESPIIEPGETWSMTFPTVGKFHYYDEFDDRKIGQVIVFGKKIPGDPNNPDQPPPKDPPKDPNENPKSDGLKQQAIPKIKPTIPIEPTIPMKPISPMGTDGTDPDNCWNYDDFGNKYYDPSGIPAPPSPGVDWDYCNLDGHDYSGEDLSYATIRFGSTVETDFSNTLLNNAQFGMPSGLPPMHVDVTDSTDAIFTGANGKDTQFLGVTLNGANFDNAKMPRVLFDGAGMTDVSMVRAYMPEASLMWANVIDSDLRNANLKYSDMTHVNLESTDLSNAMLYRVIFDEGLLVDAWFTNAHMDESTLRNVDGSAGYAIDRISKYDDASMKEVIICNSNFNDATFEDADLTNSVFNDCVPPKDEISFLGTNLHNAEFMGVFIPATSPSSFPSMIDGTSPISGESTDKSCFRHPYCDLEPVAGTAPPPPPPDSIFTEIDGEYFYDVDGELLPVADGGIIQVIRFAEGSAFPGCESDIDGCYLPSTLVKEIGLRVLWVNDDTSPHTVTSGSPADGPSGYFDSGLMMGDDTFEFPFEEEGTFDYFCMVHPWMSGTVIIVPETPDD